MKTTEDWHEIGFSQGVEAGNAPIVAQRRDFGPHEANFAMVHDALDGIYQPVSRPASEFANHEQIAAWTAGVAEGAKSVGARVGAHLATDDPEARGDGGTIVYVLVTKWPRASDAIVN
jgi:hypothetical protein